MDVQVEGPQHNGAWEHAPVVYVIGQVTFQPILAIGTYLATIQEKFRQAGFPLFETYHMQQITARLHGAGIEAIRQDPQDFWEMLTLDKRSAFLLSTSYLTFHTTAYVNFEAFADKLSMGLGYLLEVLGDVIPSRIGLRYVDFLSNGPELPLSSQIAPGLLGLSSNEIGAGGETSYQFQQVFSAGATTLVVRAIRGLGAETFKNSIGVTKLEFGKNAQSDPSMILDIDHSEELVPSSFTTAKPLVDIFMALQGLCRSAFLNILTEDAQIYFQRSTDAASQP